MDALVVDATTGKDVLDITKAEQETIIRPNGMANDPASEMVTFEGVKGWYWYPFRLHRNRVYAKATMPTVACRCNQGGGDYWHDGGITSCQIKMPEVTGHDDIGCLGLLT